MAELLDHERVALDALARSQVRLMNVASVVGISEYGLVQLGRLAREKLPPLIEHFKEEKLTAAGVQGMFSDAKERAEESGDVDAAKALQMLHDVPLPDDMFKDLDAAKLVDGLFQQVEGRVRSTARAAALTFAHATLDDTVMHLLEVTRSGYSIGWIDTLRKRGRVGQDEAAETTDREIDRALKKARTLPKRVGLLLDVCAVSLKALTDGKDDQWLSDLHELRKKVVHGDPLRAADLSDEDLALLTLLPARLALVVVTRCGVDPTEHIGYLIQTMEAAMSGGDQSGMTYDEERTRVIDLLRPLFPYLAPPVR